MRVHEHFEWDDAKSESNLQKHEVSFADAAYVLADELGDRFHVDMFDPKHSAIEDRYVTLASHPDDRDLVMVISWTDRSTESTQVTRIISARMANRKERKRYAQEINDG